MPCVLATTHETPQIAHTSLSFPSLTHPHFDAATASTAGALFAYVVSLNVPSRARNAAVEEGRYSAAGVLGVLGSAGVERDAEGWVNGKARFVRDAVRERMAARCGAVCERAARSSGAELCGCGCERGRMERRERETGGGWTYGAGALASLRSPYFASVE